MFFNKAKRNTKKLLNTCGNLIDKYELCNTRLAPSCKIDLITSINDELQKAQDEIAEWEDYDTDYVKIAHTLLAHHAFDLLSSGKYHIHFGTLNPIGCSSNLMIVYQESMKWGVRNQLLTEAERQEQYKYLISCIAEVG